jgi:hypothetical protein
VFTPFKTYSQKICRKISAKTLDNAEQGLYNKDIVQNKFSGSQRESAEKSLKLLVVLHILALSSAVVKNFR